MKAVLFTHKDRMKGKCSHREYFGQFITEAIKNIVKSRIGIELLTSSIDEHLNDIPLKKWDNLNQSMKDAVNKTLWRKAACPEYIGTHTFLWSLSDGVCIAKEAAKQIKEAE